MLQGEHKILTFDIHGDERGKLISLESIKNIPFDIRRVYYIFGTDSNLPRGFHAHRKLKQILIAVNGSLKIKVETWNEKAQYELNSPAKGLYLSGPVWREMFDFQNDCVLLVLASDFYNEEDYIRDKSVFNKMKRYTESDSN